MNSHCRGVQVDRGPFISEYRIRPEAGSWRMTSFNTGALRSDFRWLRQMSPEDRRAAYRPDYEGGMECFYFNLDGSAGPGQKGGMTDADF